MLLASFLDAQRFGVARFLGVKLGDALNALPAIGPGVNRTVERTAKIEVILGRCRRNRFAGEKSGIQRAVDVDLTDRCRDRDRWRLLPRGTAPTQQQREQKD